MKQLVVIVLLFCGMKASSQSSGNIGGIVLDAASGKPVDYATISLFADSGATPLNGTVTDERGRFLLKGVKPGSYRLITDFIGYRRDTLRRILASGQASVTDTIRLQPGSRTLSGVTVTGNAPVIENKIDKIVYNAANDLTSQGSTTLDMLRKVPQVTVDIDGNVALQGNANIRFLINGKPSGIFGASLADALAAIPASQIARIEAITTPGARYDAQGTGGIINIILKENRLQGYNGNISLSGGTRLENGSLNLNMRKGKFGVDAFFSGNAQLSSHTPSMQNRLSKDTAAQTSTRLLQDGYSDFERSGFETGIGLEWSPTKKDNLTGGISYDHFGNRSRSFVSRQNILQNNAGATLSAQSAFRNAESRFHDASMDLNLEYGRTFGQEGHELSVAYEGSYGRPGASYAQSQTMTGQSLPFAGEQGGSTGAENETSLSVDYTQPLNDDAEIETGLKTTLVGISSGAAANVLDLASNAYLPDSTQSYSLRYDMAVYAGYASASFRLLDFLDVKAGARYEYTSVRVDFPGTDIPPYGILAPTLILSHKWKHDQTLKLAYTRRIERAEYDEINPFVNRSDPYNLTTGNPLLKPEIGNNMELGYSGSFGKGTSLNVSLIERINTQDHKRVVDFYNTYRVGDSLYRDVSVQRVQNAGTEYSTGVNVSGSAALKGGLTLRGNLSFYSQYFAPSLAVLGNSSGIVGYRLRSNLNIGYTFAHDLAAEAFGNYNAPARNIQGRTPQSLTYTLALRKQFRNKKASLGITATNPFSRYIRQLTTIATDAYTSTAVRLLPYRSFGISATWKFGKLEMKKEREEDNSFLNNPPGGGN